MRPKNNAYEHIPTTNKTSGLNYYPLWNLPIITQPMLPQEYPSSSPIKDITWKSTDLQPVTTSMEAKRFVANPSELQEELKNNIVKAQEHYQQNADHNRAEALDLQIG